MSMLKFIFKRAVSGVVALLLFTFLMFVIIEVALPGDYATPYRLGMTADELDFGLSHVSDAFCCYRPPSSF